jgi:hypothetical protein
MSEGERSEVLKVGPIQIWFDKGLGIAMTAFDDGAELVFEHTRPYTEALRKVQGGAVTPLLLDYKKLKSVTKECRDYYAKDPDHLSTISAAALVVNSSLTRMIANFFIGLNKSARPTRMFNDRESAIKWLQSQATGKG